MQIMEIYVFTQSMLHYFSAFCWLPTHCRKRPLVNSQAFVFLALSSASFNNSTIQQFNNLTIQQFNNGTI